VRSRAEADTLLALARETNSRALEAAALALGAWAAVWMEDFDEGVAAASEAIRVGTDAGFLPPVGGGFLITGFVHAITARHDEADVELARALAVCEQVHDFDRQGQVRFLIGTLRNWHGRYAEGRDVAAEGTRIAREHRLVNPLTRCLWAEGVSLAGLGDYDGAQRALGEALALAEKSGDEAYLSRTLNTLGWLHIDCHDFAAGFELSERGLAIARTSRDATGPERAAFTLINEGESFTAQGELALAGEVLEEAYHIVRHPPRSRWMTWRYATHCYASLGDLALSRGDPSRANAFADESLAIAVPTRSRKYESRAWRLKGACAVLQRSWEDAEAAFARALAIATEIAEPRQLWQTHAAIAALHAARRRTGEAEQSLAAASPILDQVRSAVRHPELAAGLARVQAGLLRES
jgi:tetratricopeptide (TPR) repeat protein